MAAPPTVVVPGPLGGTNAPHVSGSTKFNTIISQLQATGDPSDQATAQALQQISNALGQIVGALTKSSNFVFNVPVAYHIIASATLSLTNSYVAVPGLALTLPTSGQYLILTSATGTMGASSGTVLTQLDVNGNPYTNSSDARSINTGGAFNMTGVYVYEATAGDKLVVNASLTGTPGSANVLGGSLSPDSTLTAIWLHGGFGAPATGIGA